MTSEKVIAQGEEGGILLFSDAALFDAIKAQNISLVNYLLDHGANVNAKIVQTTEYAQWEQVRYLRETTPLVAALA
jgi:hypothetical protein